MRCVQRSRPRRRATAEGWRSAEHRRPDGSIDSEQRGLVTHPVVEVSDEGARRLGEAYWLAVAGVSRGLVRRRSRGEGVELQVAGLRRPLLAFEPAEAAVEGENVTCSYAIRGGALARRAGGTLTLAQTGGRQPQLTVAVRGFFPRRILLVGHLQRRLHLVVSRHFIRRLVAEAKT